MLRKAVVSASLAALLATTTLPVAGCYGSFAVTKKLYDWNGQISNKWVNTVVFWAFIIVPAYELVAFGDFIIFNVIEFWSGSNPIGGAKTAAATPRALPDGGVAVEHHGTRYTLVPATADRYYLLADGVAVGSARVSPAGDLTLAFAGRPDTIRLGHAELARTRARLAAAGLVPAL
jgi:hypothetical protein